MRVTLSRLTTMGSRAVHLCLLLSLVVLMLAALRQYIASTPAVLRSRTFSSTTRSAGLAPAEKWRPRPFKADKPPRSNMKVIPYQVRKADNWMYLVIDEKSNEAAVVDPWDHEQMTQRVKENGVKVGSILTGIRAPRCADDVS